MGPDDLFKLIAQLLVLGVAGGAVSWFYSKLQRSAEQRRMLLRELASIHSQFVALRYIFNSMHVNWGDNRNSTAHPLDADEQRRERWALFQSSCSLIGEFQALRPLLHETFPDVKEDVEFVFAKYQEWRRLIGRNRPILQEDYGKSTDAYNELRDIYSRIVWRVRKSL